MPCSSLGPMGQGNQHARSWGAQGLPVTRHFKVCCSRAPQQEWLPSRRVAKFLVGRAKTSTLQLISQASWPQCQPPSQCWCWQSVDCQSTISWLSALAERWAYFLKLWCHTSNPQRCSKDSIEYLCGSFSTSWCHKIVAPVALLLFVVQLTY